MSCQLESELIHSCCCRALPVPLPFSSSPALLLLLLLPPTAGPWCHRSPGQKTSRAQNLICKFYRCSFFSPTRMERPLEMSALGVVQSSPPHTPLVLWFYIAAWTGGRGNCSQQKGVLFPALSACLGIGFHLGDVMKEILQQKQLLHPSFGSVLPIPALC